MKSALLQHLKGGWLKMKLDFDKYKKYKFHNEKIAKWIAKTHTLPMVHRGDRIDCGCSMLQNEFGEFYRLDLDTRMAESNPTYFGWVDTDYMVDDISDFTEEERKELLDMKRIRVFGCPYCGTWEMDRDDYIKCLIKKPNENLDSFETDEISEVIEGYFKGVYIGKLEDKSEQWVVESVCETEESHYYILSLFESTIPTYMTTEGKEYEKNFYIKVEGEKDNLVYGEALFVKYEKGKYVSLNTAEMRIIQDSFGDFYGKPCFYQNRMISRLKKLYK